MAMMTMTALKLPCVTLSRSIKKEISLVPESTGSAKMEVSIAKSAIASSVLVRVQHSVALACRATCRSNALMVSNHVAI